jgi:DHA2 family multidrug resistance protein
MNVLDSSIANVSIPPSRATSASRSTKARGSSRVFAAANAISMPLTGWLTQRFGAGAPVRRRDPAVRAVVVAVRHRAQPAEVLLAARVSARRRGGPADSAVAGVAAWLAIHRKKQHGARAVGHDDHWWRRSCGPRSAAGSRTTYLVVDLLHQHPGRHVRGLCVTWAIYRDRETPTRSSCPSTRSGSPSLVTWVGSLQIMLDKGKDLDWFHSPVIVGLALTAISGFCSSSSGKSDRAPSDRRYRPVQGPQLRSPAPVSDLGRLWPVLRQPGDAAAVDAEWSAYPSVECRDS